MTNTVQQINNFKNQSNDKIKTDFSGLAQWKWNDVAETQFLYYWDEVPVWEDEEYVEIPELTSTKLKIIEGEDTYILQPVSTKKSAMIKSSKILSNRLTSGFFNK